MNATALAACVHAGNIQAMTAIPGVGKKTAERLIVELRDKLAAIGDGAEGQMAGNVPASDGKQDEAKVLMRWPRSALRSPR